MSSEDMEIEQNEKGQIHHFHLKGHNGQVLCLDHGSSKKSWMKEKPIHDHSDLLMSGSDDGTARLWDLRNNKTSLCIISPTNSKEITSVAFSPPQIIKPDGCLSDSNSFAQNRMVYMSVGSNVYGYDLRKATVPIIREYDYNLSPILQNEDEVNQITFSYAMKKSDKVHIAAADDNGEIQITDSIFHNAQEQDREDTLKKGKSSTKSLQHAQDGAALVTSIGFRPRSKGLDLASGGTDCMIHLWDITRPWKPSASFEIVQDDAGANQVCNPPMVHSLAWSPSGRLLASGLGDGSCSILAIDGRRLVEACRLTECHDAAVACVRFPDFGTNQSSHVTAEDRLLVSAGNDGAILLWDLGMDVAGKHAVDPNTMFHGCQSTNTDDVNESKMASLSLNYPPEILFGIPHQKKPNWVVNSNRLASSLPSSLFVADVSKDITVYILPYQS